MNESESAKLSTDNLVCRPVDVITLRVGVSGSRRFREIHQRRGDQIIRTVCHVEVTDLAFVDEVAKVMRLMTLIEAGIQARPQLDATLTRAPSASN